MFFYNKCHLLNFFTLPLLISHRTFQRRNAAAFTIQCCHYHQKQRLRFASSFCSWIRLIQPGSEREEETRLHIQSPDFSKLLSSKSLYFDESCGLIGSSVLVGSSEGVSNFCTKLFRFKLIRSCLEYFLFLKHRKWAARFIARNIKRSVVFNRCRLIRVTGCGEIVLAMIFLSSSKNSPEILFKLPGPQNGEILRSESKGLLNPPPIVH
jgi:hypothetical protein